MPGVAMIEIHELYKAFDALEVLRGVGLTIERGESVVVIGVSGCGKSVLLKHIIGLLRPDQGRVMVSGQPIHELPERQLYEMRRKIGMLFQHAALFDSLTVGENVGFFLREHTDLSRQEVARRVAEKLEVVGLRGIEDQYPVDLSGGMRKRVGLARAIANEPEILLYDEPTTGLDPIRADAINQLIVQMRKRLAVTSIAITHDMVSAYTIADRIAMLHEGRIIFTGTPDDVRRCGDPVVAQFIEGEAGGPITAH